MKKNTLKPKSTINVDSDETYTIDEVLHKMFLDSNLKAVTKCLNEYFKKVNKLEKSMKTS